MAKIGKRKRSSESITSEIDGQPKRNRGLTRTATITTNQLSTS